MPSQTADDHASASRVLVLEPDLDLEADLSVDSIKRAEIAGELATRLNLDTGGDVEELAKARTAAASNVMN